MKEIILDIETTGFNPREGHRIVEIGCVEIYNLIPTGRIFHTYLNPQRDIPIESFEVHGLSQEFLSQHLLFHEKAEEFLSFIHNSRLVIHNALFDLRFLNFELKKIGYPELSNAFVDTLAMARNKFPGAQASLDALCSRFKIENKDRVLHGALKDAHLLAQVYLELNGGKQPSLNLDMQDGSSKINHDASSFIHKERPYRSPRSFPATHEEKAHHDSLLALMKTLCQPQGKGQAGSP